MSLSERKLHGSLLVSIYDGVHLDVDTIAIIKVCQWLYGHAIVGPHDVYQHLAGGLVALHGLHGQDAFD